MSQVLHSPIASSSVKMNTCMSVAASICNKLQIKCMHVVVILQTT